MTSTLIQAPSGRLFRKYPNGKIAPVDTESVYYMFKQYPRRTVIWHLAYGEWPDGYVTSTDGTERPHTLRIQLTKTIGVFTPKGK